MLKKVLLALLIIPSTFAAERVVNLVVAYKTVNFAGKPCRAIAINNQIPGPVLHFEQNDHVMLNVYNHLDQDTSIHWHGLLLPWQMDGVEGVSQKPIPPGGVFHYQYTLYQSGSYWYHAHSGLQEQEGVYGAYIIDPIKPPLYFYNKDFSVVLSDWNNIPAEQVFRDLKKDGDYFSPNFPIQPSLMRFFHEYCRGTQKQRKKLFRDYLSMQKMRMSIYDFSDVAYDAFLFNGHTPSNLWKKQVNVGDVVRLRFVGAASSTIFWVKIPGTKMTLVQVDGNNVKPQAIKQFTIAAGETYDVLVNIKENRPYIIYAESSDTVGAAIGALITDSNQSVNIQNLQPFPVPPPISMGMHGHGMPMKTKAVTKGTKYQHLIAAVKTNNPKKPIEKVIKMELFGWMHHYIWFLNGLPEYKAKPIMLKQGKRYRIIFTNKSMMKHPMHIHGHWFILRNGHGEYDPLMHTILVPPGATAVADVDTDASGQWFFHCHHLYHMMAGMANVFQYKTIIEIAKGQMKPQDIVKQTPLINRPIVRIDKVMPLDPGLIFHPSGHHPGFYWATFVDFGEDPFHNVQMMTYKGLYGKDYHKLELLMKDAEVSKNEIENLDIDIFYWHPVAQFWAIKGGANYFYRPAEKHYWQPGIGIEGLIPFFIETDLRFYYYKGSVKFDLEFERDTQITNNFFIRLAIRSIFATKTVPQAWIGSGLNQMRYSIRPFYRIGLGINVFAQYEYEKYYGAFKHFRLAEGDSSSENTITFGFSYLF